MIYRESRQEAESHGQSLQEAIFVDGSLVRKQETTEAKYDGQSLQEVKIGGLVYTLCSK